MTFRRASAHRLSAVFTSSRLFSIGAASAFGAVALVGCGGSPPPPAAAPAASTPIVAAPPPADVSAVEEPKNLVVFARLSKPSDALKVIGGWARMPMPGADAVGEMLAGDAIGPIVDLDQPIDFAMEATPRGMSVKPNAAISAAVKSLDVAKASLAKYKLVPIETKPATK